MGVVAEVAMRANVPGPGCAAAVCTRRAGKPYWGWPFVVLAALLAGCREELGPVVARTARVTGEVRVGGIPVRGGWIEFGPIDGTVGNLRTAPIGRDGRFDATGVAVGRNRIGLAQAPIAMQRQFRLTDSPIVRDIPAGGAELSIDLLVEAIRQQDEKAEALPETSR